MIYFFNRCSNFKLNEATFTNINYLTIKTLNLPAEICFAGSNPALAVVLSMQEVKAGFV